MYVHTRERDIRPGFGGVKIKFYYYYYYYYYKFILTSFMYDFGFTLGDLQFKLLLREIIALEGMLLMHEVYFYYV